ncbi:MAG: hypothetical protein E2P06_08495 [Acidobacteria bacterium]|nr:MAG: hypothetical protein E2P06_08495 [Acidobacteriota bacterium]
MHDFSVDLRISLVVLALPLAAVAGQTSGGQADLQGLWTNSTTTPLERPATMADRAVLTDAEVAALDAQAVGRNDRPPRPGDPGTYNEFWWERGTRLHRTSLVVDPSDGRIPAMTVDGQARAAWARGGDSWTNRNLAERCITRGAPKRPGGYNNNFLILQTPGYVAILQEMIHEVRLIPLDGRPHIGDDIRLWMGDSRGRWDGDTLVVETTNFSDQIVFNSYNCCPGAGANLRLVERFTRVGADTIDHRYTVEDPATYAVSWTAAIPMTRLEGPIYEYACHEGNYGMENLLRGARVQEEAAATPSTGSR